ncbi:MAG: tetratricopeptide repeat protein [Rubrivivax sp.]
MAALRGGDLVQAERRLQQILQRWPGQGDALHFMGLLRHRQQRPDAALALLRAAAAALPQEAAPRNNLGNVLASVERWAAAEQAYRDALRLQPDLADARANLGHACLRQDRLAEAAQHYRDALALQPAQALWRHQLAACEPDRPPPRASDAYLSQVFDEVAARFDQHLGELRYDAPARVSRAVERLYAPPAAQLDIADLGCGTGLCAPGLRPYAHQLSGCDLSAGMLDRARARGLYDRLERQDLMAFLGTRTAAFDLLVAADTLIYLGDLHPLMVAATAALRPGGRFVFSIESLPDGAPQPVRLQPHGRFAHRADHVRQACAVAGLRLDEPEPFVLRLEQGVPVDGWLGVAQRP